eukprot:297906-Pyramimonas_sp.AAC.1
MMAEVGGECRDGGCRDGWRVRPRFPLRAVNLWHREGYINNNRHPSQRCNSRQSHIQLTEQQAAYGHLNSLFGGFIEVHQWCKRFNEYAIHIIVFRLLTKSEESESESGIHFSE